MSNTVDQVLETVTSLFGGNERQAKLWLASSNTHLDGSPNDIMKTPEGLETVVAYLERMRGA